MKDFQIQALENYYDEDEKNLKMEKIYKKGSFFEENHAIYGVRGRNLSKQEKEKLWEKAQSTRLDIYIKTLFEAYRNLPNIIKVIDKIIESRATISTFYSVSRSQSTYEEIDKIISLSERKDKLLNLYIIAEELLNMLSDDEKKLINMKYVKKRTVDAIALEIGLHKRNVYRSLDRIIKRIAIKMLLKNWDANFIKFQIGDDEKWLNEIFSRKLNEEEINKQRGKSLKGA